MRISQFFKKWLGNNKAAVPQEQIVPATRIDNTKIKPEKKAKLIRKIKIKKGIPCSVDWSLDGVRLVVGDSDGGIQVHTTEGRSLWRKITHYSNVYCVNWSKDSMRIASGANDGKVRVYDAATGNVLLQEHSGSLTHGITWSSDNRHIAWATQERNGIAATIIRVFNLVTGKVVVECKGHTSSIIKVAWSPLGNLLASGAEDQTLRIWDATNGLCLKCLNIDKSSIPDICWSPNGKHLAVALSRDNTIHIWNIQTEKCVVICKGHSGIITSIRWSPDGAIIASSSLDKTVRLWDTCIGAQLLLLNHNEVVSSIAFSPEGERLVSASGYRILRLWDISDFMQAKKEEIIDTPFQQYIGLQTATIGILHPALKGKAPWVPHLSEAEGECLGVLRYPNQSWSLPSVAMFPDNYSIATGHGDSTVRRWDLRTGAILWQGTEKHSERIIDIAVSPDGTLVATTSHDNTVRTWDAQTGQCLRQLMEHEENIQRVRWSPDGKRIASIEFSSTKQLRTWDAQTGACLWIGEEHTNSISSLDWSRDGRFIATCDRGGNIVIWDAESGQNLQRFNCHYNVIWGLRWSPDSRFLLIGFYDGTVLVVNALNGSVRFRLQGHTGSISALDWSRDGRFIATGSQGGDKSLQVWDAETGLKLKHFTFDEFACYKLAFPSSSAFIVSSLFLWEDVKKEDVIRIWDTRDLLENKTDKTVTDAAPSTPSLAKSLPHPLRHLPSALAQMHRLNIFPPLSLVRDMLDLLADCCEIESLKTLMASNRGLHELRDLHWPFAARIGLVALLLHRLPSSEWQPPGNTTPSQVRDALITALSWEPMEPQPPAPPISLLIQAAELIDDRLISLLSMLGPHAVAADPGLPLRLLPRVKDIPALSIAQCRSLGVRISTAGISGQSSGRAPGADRVQVGDIEMGALLNDWASLLPSQLAMPPIVQMYRYLRGELLFRAREMAEPPRIRPAVILLDVSPPSFGPIEQITRLAAFTIAQSIRRAGQRVILLTNSKGFEESQWLLELNHPADLVEIWLQRTLKTVPATRGLELARVLRAGLQENDGLEPIILVLSHPWFGAEEEIPEIKNLRGLFVQYPHYPAIPVLAGKCEKWKSIEISQFNDFADTLAFLMS